MACDSQTTFGQSSKRIETNKISHFTLLDAPPELGVFVAQSGGATLTARVVEILTEKAKSVPFDDYRKPAELAQEAVRALKEEVARLNNWTDRHDWPELIQKYFLENPASIMLAYHYSSDAYLYVLDFSTGFVTRSFDYATMGCGETVAEFIMARSYDPEMVMNRAVVLSIYCVEEVKKVDAFCGGQTRFRMINKRGQPLHFDKPRGRRFVDSVVKTIAEYDNQLKSTWNKMMDEIIDKALARADKEEDEQQGTS